MILVFVFYLLYAVFNCCTVFCRDAVFVEQTLGHGDAEALEVLEGVWSSLEDIKAGGQRPTSWEDCVTWARCKWETLYNNDIRQLLHCFPPGQVKLHQSKNSPHTAVISVYGHRGALLCTSGPWYQSIKHCNVALAPKQCQSVFHFLLFSSWSNSAYFPRAQRPLLPSSETRTTKPLLINISEHLWGFVIWWSMQTEWCHMLLSHLGGHGSVSTQTDPHWTQIPVQQLAATTLIICPWRVVQIPLAKIFFHLWLLKCLK